ncbi:TIGR03086 family metal-binding protein [Saccharopolyspora hirsuta]|uniref:TIGR03086 family metal-binding protein n=1 Tax=Saccharopolyspora hirsuta TaxID=1837 RepID=UPI00332606C9
MTPRPEQRASAPVTTEQLAQALSAVGALVDGVRDDQWSDQTPCADWTVRDLINHLVQVNESFSAQLHDRTPPGPDADLLGDDPVGAYRRSAAELVGSLDRSGNAQAAPGPLGVSTGAERVQLRLADLLAHGWDLARATGQEVGFPEDVVEQALVFVRGRLDAAPRADRFGEARPVAEDAPVVDRFAAFLGRSPEWTPGLKP